MSDKRYEANIIRATAVEPANNLQTTSAPGVWSIDEVVELQKKSKWPTVGNVADDVTDVFSTLLYDGIGDPQVIENGIALGNSNDGGSAVFSGTSANTNTRVNIPTSSNFNFGTGDFTIEAFINIKTSKNYHNIYDQRTPTQDATTNSPIIYIDSNNYIIFYVGGSGRAYSSSLVLGTWYHVAVTRASGSTKMFLDGTQQGSTYSDSLTYVQPASDFSFGGSLEQNSYNLDGFISNLRVVKGTALYTSNFTAPTAALTAVSGTSLLTAQGSTPFVDNSGNSVALTLNNSPVASEFGPFAGTGGKGGLVWIKRRDATEHNDLYDTERGVKKDLRTNATTAEGTEVNGLQAFNTNGFNVGSDGLVGGNGGEYVSWTFRKQTKFFDIVTYTGDGTAGRTISHNLGSVPGMIIVKITSGSDGWHVYHRKLNSGSSPEDWYFQLNSTDAQIDNATIWNDTAPTDSVFTVGTNGGVNGNGSTYVAYIFAHNNNDGGFGPTGSDDIIKCGSFTGVGSGAVNVNLGFEPQWIIVKNATRSEGWFIQDTIRGMAHADWEYLLSNENSAASGSATNRVVPTASGFTVNNNGSSAFGQSGDTVIYMAIRRGPLAAPTDATKVFQPRIYTGAGGSGQKISLNITPDMVINMSRSTSGDSPALNDRLRGSGKEMYTSGTGGESSYPSQGMQLDHTNALRTQTYRDTNSATYVNFCWKRAPSYFEVCCYTGTGSARTVSHNLGVAPEMMWIKDRDDSEDWSVYHAGITNPEQNYLYLNNTGAVNQNANTIKYWNHTNPTSSVFTVGDEGRVNQSGEKYVAYLFATVAGVSKMGNVVHSGSSTDVDCGFTSGARLVILKRTDATGDWYIWDSVRGIVSGNDPYLLLNSTAAEVTNTDYIDPLSSGFQISGDFTDGTYIFYAVAT